MKAGYQSEMAAQNKQKAMLSENCCYIDQYFIRMWKNIGGVQMQTMPVERLKFAHWPLVQ